MPAPPGADFHFGCTFVLVPDPEAPGQWRDLIATVHRWLVGKHPTLPGLRSRWFFEGGEWKEPGRPRVFIQTAALQGDPAQSPDLWAVRYEHPCDQTVHRQWRTDIGFERQVGGTYRASLAVRYWIRAGYIGPEPIPPASSAPRVASMLLKVRGWDARSGSERLRPEPEVCRPGHGLELEPRLASSAREIPVILVSLDPGTDQPMLDAAQLAKLLTGATAVVVPERSSVEDEIEWVVRRPFGCRGGMVRVYQPGVRFGTSRDAGRHRFFTRDEIRLQGPNAVTQMIVDGVVRRSPVMISGGIMSVYEVLRAQHERRLKNLRETGGTSSLQEMVELQESILSELETEKGELKEKLRRALGQVEEDEAEIMDLRDQLGTLSGDRDRIQQTLVQVEVQVRRLEATRTVPTHLAELPRSLRDVVDVIAGLWPDRLVFTDRAQASAKKASFGTQGDDLKIAWRCLWAMATKLYPMFFDGSGGDVERRFLEDSGFGLSLTEGKSTNRDKKLQRLREDIFEGETIDITPHVKHGNREPRCLRVHFYPDHARRRLIIGHCGDHLDTFGTQWSK